MVQSTKSGNARRVIRVSLAEFATRFEAKIDALISHKAQPFWFAMQSSREAGSWVVFEESEGLFIAVEDKNVRLDVEGTRSCIIDADAARARRALIMDAMLARDPSLWGRIGRWFWAFAPYGYVKLRGGKWLAINRDHEPLGLPRGTWADYEGLAGEADRFLSHPADLEGVWSDVSERRDRVFLYNDDPASRDGYFTRLLKLDDHVALPGETPTPLQEER